MTILESYRYVQDRLNNLSTNKNDNVPKHTFVRIFNAMQIEWVEERIKLADTNSVRIDELQQIEVLVNPTLLKEKGKWTFDLPEDYLHKKRIIAYTPCELYLYPKKESEVNRLLADEFWKPSLEWQESFYTISGNKVNIYGDFTITSADFTYYRTPVKVNMNDGYTDDFGVANLDIDPEFKNSNLLEILNKVIMQLSADTLDQFHYQTSGQKVTSNT